MPLYVADYLSATGHLNAAESGAYLHLLMHAWQKGRLPSEDRFLARIARMNDRQWAAAKPTLQEFFDGGWVNSRLEKERAKALSKAEARAESGSRGGIAKALKQKNSVLAKARGLPDDSYKQNGGEPLPSSQGLDTTTVVSDSSLRSLSGDATDAQPNETPQTQAASTARKATRSDRGARLPEDWRPPSASWEVADVLGLTREEVERVLVEFKNYWLSETGPRSRKLSWDRTFQNRLGDIAPRILRERARAGPRTNSNDLSPRMKALSDVYHELPSDDPNQPPYLPSCSDAA